VHLTGGEPLVRSGAVELVAMLAREGLADLALTTNGQGLARVAARLRRAGLERVNVSLDSLRPDRFRQATGGGELARTLEGLDAAIRCGLRPVKLNVVVVRGYNLDEIGPLAEFGMRRGCQVRFLELMPIGPAAARFAKWFVPSREVLAGLGETLDLRPLDSLRPRGTTRCYQARSRDGTEGVIGVISSCSAPFCKGCRRLRLTSTGELIGCLARGEGLFVRPLLDDEPALAEAVGEVLGLKRGGAGFSSRKIMSSTGG
jgi:cyclic pyranopterin phosphate synthase